MVFVIIKSRHVLPPAWYKEISPILGTNVIAMGLFMNVVRGYSAITNSYASGVSYYVNKLGANLRYHLTRPTLNYPIVLLTFLIVGVDFAHWPATNEPQVD